MKNINDIINILNETAQNPKKAVDVIIEKGKKVCGIMPAFVPEEIAYAAGYIPVGIWGSEGEIKNAQSVMPPFCCSIMMSVIENQLKGVYDVCDFIVVSSLCDTLKCMGQKYKGKSPIIQISHPHNRNIENAVDFAAEEYSILREKIENIRGSKITDRDIFNAIEVYNENRKALRRFGEISHKHSDIMTPVVRRNVFKSGYFMDRKNHTELINSLCDLLEEREAVSDKKGVILTGIIADDSKILDMLYRNDFYVASDDIVNESGFANLFAPDEKDPIISLAKMWTGGKSTLFAYDPFKKRAEHIIDEVKRTGAAGVVFCYMPFCDVDAFDEPIIVKRLKEENIPFIKIDFGMQDTNYSRAETKIEAFSEMLEL